MSNDNQPVFEDIGVSVMNKNAIGESWKDVKNEFLTEAERDEIALRVNVIGEIIKAREVSGMSQDAISSKTGVKQSVISRMEQLETNPQLETVLKILNPLGKTLGVIDLEQPQV